MDPLENTELLTEICRAIAEHPDRIEIKEYVTGDALDLRIICHPNDAGRIVGKNGETIQAIRRIFFTIAFYDQTSILIDLDESVKDHKEKQVVREKQIRIVNE